MPQLSARIAIPSGGDRIGETLADSLPGRHSSHLPIIQMNPSRAVGYAQNELFTGVPIEVVRRSELRATPIAFDTNDVIFEEGDLPDYFYLVESGQVRITKALPSGRHERLAMIDPGEFFGDLALYDNSPRSARATAAVPTRVYRLSKEDFDDLRRSAPLEIETRLAEAAIERVRLTNSRLVNGLASSGRLAELGSDLGELAHYLRGPLTTITGTANLMFALLSDGKLDRQEMERWLEAIRRNSNKGIEEIDDLLGRLRGERTKDELATVRTSDILREVRDLTFGYLASPAVHYSDENCTYTGDVTVDASEFASALADLVKNSVEALPAEGGEISVNVALEGAFVAFSVSDTGAGIDPAHLALIFDRDFTYGKEGGTGIGLSHAREVAEKHGGNISVDSEVGLGTTVRIRIPRRDVVRQAED